MVGLPLRALSRPIQVVSGRQETLQTILPQECREAFCFCFAQPVLPFNSRFVGDSECAGINRHVVGDARALQERRQRLHPGLESCRGHREVSREA
jgi:hypothetical protein